MEKQMEVLITANTYIDKLKVGINNVVNDINSGNENSAMNAMNSIFDGIEWLTNVISLTRDLHKGKVSIGNTNEVLLEMIESLENEDYVLISDLFQYEFLPVIEGIQSDIRNIITD